MLFNIPLIADWHKIGDQRQLLTDRGNQQENAKRIDYGYKVGDKVLVINEGILRKAESAYGKEPWNNYSSYEWNYQDSRRNKNGTT